MGRLAETEQVDAAFTLPLRNQGQLTDLLKRLSDPKDPKYGHYLTPAEFAAQFGPTQADYDAVKAYALSKGLTITGTHTNRLLLDVSGSRNVVEEAFGVRLFQYLGRNGRVFRAPDSTPSVPASLAGVISGVVGLSNADLRHPYMVRPGSHATTPGGTGPGGGFSPTDIKAAYNFSAVKLDGTGQSLALFEFDGYTATDVTAYVTKFNLTPVPLDNILVDGASGTPSATDGPGEVTLDIELQNALAPAATKIYVYETPNTDTGGLDGYSKIAEDDLAKQISTSWGLDEQDQSSDYTQGEYPIFQQMAAQGQTIYAAAGDDGAYDSGLESDGLRVDDPGTQPYVCSVGGTSLTTQTAGGPWASETTWNNGLDEDSDIIGAGGGGISTVWPIPSWQVNAINSASEASTSMRNVPDVSLNADPDTGYAFYYGAAWQITGGTSCASPLWAAFTALINQQRVSDGLAVLGQANPVLYPILSTTAYTEDFHDIADDSTNLFFPAVTGYDDATGLGTLNGANLLSALAPGASTGVPAAPTKLTAAGAVASVALSWTASTNATSYNVYRSQTSGSNYVNIGASTTTGFTDTNVSNGTIYYYVVTAYDAAGESPYSNAASATPFIVSFPAGVNFISLPYDYSSFSLSAVLGYSNPILAVWNPSSLAYALSPTSPANVIHLGGGYWVRFPKTVNVTLTGTTASSSETSYYPISLSTGWNQIGVPYSTPASPTSIAVVSGGQTYSLSAAVSKGLIGPLVYYYNTTTHAYGSLPAGTSDLQPFQGYFIDAFANATLEIYPS